MSYNSIHIVQVPLRIKGESSEKLERTRRCNPDFHYFGIHSLYSQNATCLIDREGR